MEELESRKIDLSALDPTRNRAAFQKRVSGLVARALSERPRASLWELLLANRFPLLSMGAAAAIAVGMWVPALVVGKGGTGERESSLHEALLHGAAQSGVSDELFFKLLEPNR